MKNIRVGENLPQIFSKQFQLTIELCCIIKRNFCVLIKLRMNNQASVEIVTLLLWLESSVRFQLVYFRIHQLILKNFLHGYAFNYHCKMRMNFPFKLYFTIKTITQRFKCLIFPVFSYTVVYALMDEKLLGTD